MLPGPDLAQFAHPSARSGRNVPCRGSRESYPSLPSCKQQAPSRAFVRRSCTTSGPCVCNGAGNFLFDVLLARRVRTHVKLLVALDDCISNANGGTNHSEGVDAHEAVTRIDAMHAVEPTLPRPTKARKCHDGA